METNFNEPIPSSSANIEIAKKTKLFNWLSISLIIALPIFMVSGFFIGRASVPNPIVQEEIFTLDQAQQMNDSLYSELKDKLSKVRSEVDSLGGIDYELLAKEEELEKQYLHIQNLIKQAKQDKSSRLEIEQKLVNLKAELGSMKDFVSVQSIDIDKLRYENKRLISERNDLDEQVKREKSEKEKIASRYKSLSENQTELIEKVDKASILQVSGLKTIGARLRTNGEEKEMNVAKKAEYIKVCFDVVRNEVVRSGLNKFYIRIIDPKGNILFEESKGSGSFKLKDNSKETEYTTMKSFNYNQDLRELCLQWDHSSKEPFISGTYHLELYNQGQRVAIGNLELK